MIDVRTDRFAEHERTPIREHLAAFESVLLGAGRSIQHVKESKADVLRTLDAVKVERVSELAASAVQSVIATSKARGLGARTLNKSLRAVKSFSRWLVRDGRAPHDALAFIPMLNERVDRRRERRELTSEELEGLIRAAEWGATAFGLFGIDRGMLYRLAVGTGFRASELASLTPESFTLGGSPPLVVVGAAYSKHRRQDEQPSRPGSRRSWSLGSRPKRRVGRCSTC